MISIRHPNKKNLQLLLIYQLAIQQYIMMIEMNKEENVRLNNEKMQKEIMVQNPLFNIWMINSFDQKQEQKDPIQKTLQLLVII
ncbi:unnamed protein product [Paramecium sonneborni]|uniref:Uncharacterized protein n=1 Tax=Paramecium sonneborni TaxID=65129 RepID=A0A8S1REZ5_9CILI|nr:unnamed protein product [Paramecium sonneborni]